MRNLYRIIVAAVSSVLLMVGVGVVTAQAYIAKSCTVFVDARLSATAWSVGPTTSTMHLDLNSYRPASGLRLNQSTIYLDGRNLGQSENFYVNVNNTLPHTVTGYWSGSDGRLYSCSVSGASNTWK